MERKFKFLLDPLFLFSLTLYSINKLSLLGSEFWNDEYSNYYLNDLLLVPVLVPIILYVSRILNFRDGYAPPNGLEIILPLAIWSIAFELVGPFCFGKGTADPVDVLVYWLGGLTSWIIWNRGSLLNSSNTQNSRSL